MSGEDSANGAEAAHANLWESGKVRKGTHGGLSILPSKGELGSMRSGNLKQAKTGKEQETSLGSDSTNMTKDNALVH